MIVSEPMPIRPRLAHELRLAREAVCAITAPAILSIDDAYSVQADVWHATGDRVAAYKIGLTSPGGQAAFATSEPIFGRLRACELLRSGANLPATSVERFAEAELVFEIGRDLQPADMPFSEAVVAASIAGVFAGIEICSSRYIEDDVVLGALIADNGNADVLVLGERLSDGWSDRLADLRVTLTVAGQEAVVGTSANVLGNPLRAVTWLANRLAQYGEGLCKGQFVASGSCTGITAIARNDTVFAKFGERGEIQVQITLGAQKVEENDH